MPSQTMPDQKEIEKIREDFPALKQDPGPVYFDNACTTLKPYFVLEAEREYEERFTACGERSAHSWGEKTTRLCEETRRKIAKFIGARKPEEIVFVKNATEGINLVAHSLDFKEGDIVLTSDKEHNSNLLPWLWQAKQKKLKHGIVRSRSDNTFDLEKFMSKKRYF